LVPSIQLSPVALSCRATVHAATRMNHLVALLRSATSILAGLGCLELADPGSSALGAEPVSRRQTGSGFTFFPQADHTTPADLPGRGVRPWTMPAAAKSSDRDIAVVSEVDYRSLMPGEPRAHGLLVRSAGFAYGAYSAGRNPEQRFDLRTDPGETRNLARDPARREALAAHRRALRDWVKRTGAPWARDKFP